VIRTYKYPLEPNRHQAQILLGWLERCRVLYNVALEQRREFWRMAQKRIGLFDQQKELTELRAADPRYEEIPVEVCRSPLRQLQRAFEGFFRRVRRGEVPGYPRFKGRDRFDSFGIGRVPVEGKRVRVPKLGLVRFRKYRELGGEIRDARIGLRAGKWWVAFSCDAGDAPEKKPIRTAVGIDVGLTSFATLSDGTQIQNPRFFQRGRDLLARRQQALARKKRGSQSRAQAKRLVQKAHEHVRNQRVDFARKLAADLFRRYDCVYFEDLNLRGLSAGWLAASVQDAAWGKFMGALECKAECAGTWAVPVDPRGTSIRCSGCGAPVPKALSDRVHRCPTCGLVMDRDWNAARNILALGGSAAAVLGHSPSN
jgi:putative transposase